MCGGIMSGLFFQFRPTKEHEAAVRKEQEEFLVNLHEQRAISDHRLRVGLKRIRNGLGETARVESETGEAAISSGIKVMRFIIATVLLTAGLAVPAHASVVHIDPGEEGGAASVVLPETEVPVEDGVAELCIVFTPNHIETVGGLIGVFFAEVLAEWDTPSGDRSLITWFEDMDGSLTPGDFVFDASPGTGLEGGTILNPEFLAHKMVLSVSGPPEGEIVRFSVDGFGGEVGVWEHTGGDVPEPSAHMAWAMLMLLSFVAASRRVRAT